MLFPSDLFSRSGCFLLVWLAALFVPSLRALEWIAPTQEELSATVSQIDPGAGAEILYRFKQIDDGDYNSPGTDEYVRIKIFNEKGVRQFDKIEVQWASGERISSLEARVIKPNGAIINVEKQAFYDRDVIKAGNEKVRARAFSFPHLEPGDIIEYKSCLVGDSNIIASTFFFLSDIPTRRVIFRIKPAPLIHQYKTMTYFYKCDQQRVKMDGEGFGEVTLSNLPAFVSEPFMEPRFDAEPWIMFYPSKADQSPKKFWEEIADKARKRVHRYAKKPGKFVAATAARIVEGVSDPGEKLIRINDYCRGNILNYWVYASKDSLIDKIRKQYDRSPEDLIKTKLGNSDDIPVLFVALARAQGIDAHIALCSNRRDGVFKPSLPVEYYLNELFVAVKINGKWKVYDPAHNMVNTGMLRWQNEGVPAMVVLPKGTEWVVTGKTPATRSVTKRTGTMRLNDEGTLLGDVNIEYSGQAEISARHLYHSETDKKIEQLVRDDVQSRLPNAEITDIRVTNTDNVLKPLVLTYSVKIPGYADRTGQRIFIQPGFFTKGEPARFTADERKLAMFFNYAETFEDNVTIKVPAGFRLEEGSAPADIPPANWGHYKISIGMKKSENSIIYNREFSFSPLLVPPEHYKAVKHIFDAVHASDSHLLTFRMGAQ